MAKKSSILGRILLGSAIGAGIGLILLIMGIALVLKALTTPSASPVEGEAAVFARGVEAQDYEDDDDHEDDDDDDWHRNAARDGEGELDTDYPAPAPIDVPLVPLPPSEPLPPSMQSSWRSIFEEDQPAVRPAPAAPAATPPASKAPPRPATPRAAPEAKTETESLFY